MWTCCDWRPGCPKWAQSEAQKGSDSWSGLPVDDNLQCFSMCEDCGLGPGFPEWIQSEAQKGKSKGSDGLEVSGGDVYARGRLRQGHRQVNHFESTAPSLCSKFALRSRLNVPRFLLAFLCRLCWDSFVYLMAPKTQATVRRSHARVTRHGTRFMLHTVLLCSSSTMGAFVVPASLLISTDTLRMLSQSSIYIGKVQPEGVVLTHP